MHVWRLQMPISIEDESGGGGEASNTFAVLPLALEPSWQLLDGQWEAEITEREDDSGPASQ